MPRKEGSRAAQFPDEIHYRGLTPIVTSINDIPVHVDTLIKTQEAGNTEVALIRRANELILGQEVEDSE